MSARISENWVEVEGLRIHYFAAGTDGPTVLLLHGGGLDSASVSWRLALEPLAERCRVIAPDWLGYGQSDKPNITYNMAFYVDFLGKLMDALGLARASLVGISMGGGACLGFALQSPDRVEKLVPVDAYGLGGDVPYGMLSYILVRLPFVAGATTSLMGWSRSLAKWSLQSIIHDRRAITPGLVDEVYQLTKEPGAGQAFNSFQRSEVTRRGLRTNYVDRLAEIKAPTLIVHGRYDSGVPVAWAERAHKLIPGSRLHIMEAGHWPPRERPAEFNRVVREFLVGE